MSDTANSPKTFGPAYDERLDGERLASQLHRIKLLMFDGRWRTVRDIATTIHAPEPSLQAQLRHLRKVRFGGYQVDKRRVHETGLWEYRVLPPVPFSQLPLL